MTETHDVVVLGSGPAGQSVADRTVRGGLTAAVVEADLVGGECAYWACLPSKALLRPAAALAEARRVDGARQAVNGSVEPKAVLARRDAFAAYWRDDDQVSRLTSRGVALVRGQGRVTGPREVEVRATDGTVTRLTARHAVIVCTGSDAFVPEVPGLADVDPWTSRDATSAITPPERLAIIGGGAVACEMATAWSTLGSRVTLLVRGAGLLPRCEPFAGEAVRAGLGAAGVIVRTGVRVTAVHRAVGVELTLDDGTRTPADEVLIAAGRRPRTADIGLESVGLVPGRPLEVDGTGLVRDVDGDWLYAAGDVTGAPRLTHLGEYAGRVVGDAIVARARGMRLQDGPWGRHAATAVRGAVPQVIFTDPQVAVVGYTGRQAAAAGLEVRTVEFDLGRVTGAALYADGYRGVAALVVDERRRVVVGATFVGPGVGELLHAATVAVVGEVPLDRLWHAVPPSPTMSEVWLRLLETYGL